MALDKREKTSFLISVGVHVAAIGLMTYGIFSVPSLPEPPQGEIAIDFDLSGGFNNMTLKKAQENISKKPVEKTAGKAAEADVGQKEIVEKVAAIKKQKELEEKKKKLEAEKRKAEEKKRQEKRKKALAEKKKKEALKRKKALEDKKKAEEKRKKELAAKKRKEAEKKKQALLEKKKAEEGKKKRFNDNRIANLLKSKDNNKATKQKSSGSSKDPVADILSKKSSQNTGIAGKQGKNNTSNAHKLGGGLAWSDKAAIINALRPCWERYQGVAKANVTVDFVINSKGYLQGAVKYVSGDRMAFAGAKRAVPECTSPMKGVDLKKFSAGKDFRITFTPLDVRF